MPRGGVVLLVFEVLKLGGHIIQEQVEPLLLVFELIKSVINL
jgi:hypothetical protein